MITYQEAIIYEVKCFFGIFGLPTLNQILYTYAYLVRLDVA